MCVVVTRGGPLWFLRIYIRSLLEELSTVVWPLTMPRWPEEHARGYP